MSNRNFSKQRMVYKFLNNRETSDTKIKEGYGFMWKIYLDDEVDLSGAMLEVARRVGYMKNRGRAVGLFLGNDELLREEPMGEKKVQWPAEKKRGSLIEAFQHPAEKADEYEDVDWDIIPRAVVIPGVAKILDESALPNPDLQNQYTLEQYVDIKCREIA